MLRSAQSMRIFPASANPMSRMSCQRSSLSPPAAAAFPRPRAAFNSPSRSSCSQLKDSSVRPKWP